MAGPDDVDALLAPPDRRVELAIAQDLLSRGAASQAIEHFRNVLENHPRDPEARRGFARASLELGAFEEARRTVDTILADSPKDVEAWRLAASIDRETGDPQGLLRCLTEIRAIDPNDRRAALDLYHLYDIQGDPRAAYQALTDAIADGSSPSPNEPYPQLLLARAELAQRLGRAEDAAAEYEKAVAADPGLAPLAALRHARKEWADGRPDLALERLRQVFGTLDAAQRPPEELALEGELLVAVERIGEAQAIYDAWHARDPTSSTALAGAARCRIEQGHHPEARDLLHEGLAHAPRDEALILCLAEAESGSGDLSAAERAVREGIELLPNSERLYVRLAELATARSNWEGADRAYAKAEELDPASVDIALGRAFVAEKRGDTETALAEYARAQELAPQDIRIWNRQGALLLSLHRPALAVSSFESALKIDPESDAAREGKRLAEREDRNRTIEDFALAALRSESDLGRPVTKNDLFVGLHVPFDLLDPVLTAMARETKIDIGALAPGDMDRLEERSCTLIVRAAEHPSASGDSRSLTLADVASLSDPTDSLIDVQRLFAYVDAVLKLDLRPENLHLTTEMEETARQALALPPDRRTLFGLVRALHIGVYRARIIKAVERVSGAPRTPLPSVDLAPHLDPGGDVGTELDGSRFFSPENLPNVPFPDASSATGRSQRPPPRGWPGGVAPLPVSRTGEPERCVGCGGIATLRHDCGGALCRLCADQFRNCPRCRSPIGRLTASPKGRAVRPLPTVGRSDARAREAVSRPGSIRTLPPPSRPRVANVPSTPPRPAKPALSAAAVPAAGSAKSGAGHRVAPSAPSPKLTGPAGVPAPMPAKPVRKEKVDDEPRL